MRGTFIVQVFYFFFQLLHYGKSLRIFFFKLLQHDCDCRESILDRVSVSFRMASRLSIR